MTPAKLLIAQRLEEVARELRCIVELMDEQQSDPTQLEVVRELHCAAETAQWFADRIRSEP